MSVRAGVVGAVLLVLATGCSSAPAAAPPPGPAETAMRALIATLNEGADGSVAAQQQTLRTLVADGQQAVQRRCPVATSTLSFEPVWSALAPAPRWTPPQGTLAGTVYSLPTLLRIHRQGRITGTDLTDLHLAVDGTTARLPSLCVS